MSWAVVAELLRMAVGETVSMANRAALAEPMPAVTPLATTE